MNSNNALPSGVVVYCASSSDIDSLYLDVARRMGLLIADAGLTLVCGGDKQAHTTGDIKIKGIYIR